MLDLYRHDEPYYPSSDGEPMGENDVICWLMASTLDMLRRYFQDDDDVYVSSNSFVYYVKDDPTQRVAPDLYVVRGVTSEKRPNYKIWEEGVVPQVVFEFTTESSRYKDLGTKKGLYEVLGVKEYYLYDPAGEYLNPSFRAFRLVDGILQEREERTSHFSVELGLTVKPVDQVLRFYPPDSVEPVPTSAELEERAELAAALAEQEATRADKEAARADQEAARADKEAERADKEAERARQEAARAAELQRKLDELN
jgi:Uma2 family endonuclease